VTAPPEGGRANRAVTDLVAGALGLARDAVRVVAGASSPRKTLEVDGVPQDVLLERLTGAAP
jgi:uncharacterized protein YggU (UPF0235/DUF167 family)